MMNIDAKLSNADWPKRTPDRFPARRVHLGGAGSGNFGHAGRPGEIGGSAEGDGEGSYSKKSVKGKNIVRVDDEANDAVVSNVLGLHSEAAVRDLAESMVQYADQEKFAVTIMTEGGGPDEEELRESYDEYVEQSRREARNDWVAERRDRAAEIDTLWESMKAEAEEARRTGPYGDTREIPTLPLGEGEAFQPGDTAEKIEYEDLVEGLDPSAPWSEDEKAILRERLMQTGGPVQKSINQMRSEWDEGVGQDFEPNDSFHEWSAEQDDSNYSGEEVVRIKFAGSAGTQITREFKRDGNGELVVDHSYFQAGNTGGGLAKDLLRASFDEYERMGVDKVTVHANIDVGGYAWAKFGFKVDDDEHGGPDVDSLIARAERRGMITHEERLQLEDIATETDGEDTQLWAIADATSEGKKIGSAVLLGSDWYGQIRLKDKEAMNRLHKYLSASKPEKALPKKPAPAPVPVTGKPEDKLAAKAGALTAERRRLIDTARGTAAEDARLREIDTELRRLQREAQRVVRPSNQKAKETVAQRERRKRERADVLAEQKERNANRKRLGLSPINFADDPPTPPTDPPTPDAPRPGSREMFYEEADGTRADRDLWRDLLGEDFPDDLPPKPTSLYRDKLRSMQLEWDEGEHPRDARGQFEDSHSPGEALHSLLDGHKTNIDPHHVRALLKKALKQGLDADLTDLHVNGHLIFGGNGLGIARADMPQIPPEHREPFLQSLRDAGVTVTREMVNPLTLAPSQKEISARRAAEKLDKLETKGKPFKPVLVSQGNRVLDGHHHWAAAAALALEHPEMKVPIYRIKLPTRRALAKMHTYDKTHGIERVALSAIESDEVTAHEQVLLLDWDESLHPRADDGEFTDGSGGGSNASPYAVSEDAPRGGEGQQALFEYQPEAGSETALKIEASKGIAAIEKLLPDAIDDADYKVAVKSWDELDSDDQNSAEESYIDDIINDSGPSEAGQEASDAYVSEHLNESDIHEKMIEDGFAEDFVGLDERRDLDPNAYGDAYGDAKEALTNKLRDSDGAMEAYSDASREYAQNDWNELSSSEQFDYAKDHGFATGANLRPGAPDTWVWDSDREEDEPESEDYLRTRVIANELVTERTTALMKERGLPTEPGTPTPEFISQQLWDAWKSDSQSSLGYAMQIAVSEELGTHSTPSITSAEREAAEKAMIDTFTTKAERQAMSPEALGIIKEIDKLPADQRTDALNRAIEAQQAGKGAILKLAKDRVKAYVRGQWETTQFLLHQADTLRVPVYRAIVRPRDELDQTRHVDLEAGTKLPDYQLRQNAAASATTKRQVANEWNGVSVRLDPNKSQRVVLRFDAPRTAVFSLPVYGQNVYNESEVVLMGTKGLKWDAWLKEGPEFKEQRIDMARFKVEIEMDETPKPPPPPAKKGPVIDLLKDQEKHWLHPDHYKFKTRKPKKPEAK